MLFLAARRFLCRNKWKICIEIQAMFIEKESAVHPIVTGAGSITINNIKIKR